MRPTIDSLMPRRSAADRGRVEPAPGVAHEPGELGVVGLDEHVDAIDVGVAGGVDDRLADRRDERPRGVVERLVADDDGFDADVVVGLDGDRHRVDRRMQRRRLALVGRAVQPRPQLALLAPGDASSCGAGRPSAGSARATGARSRGGGRRSIARSSSRMRAARSSSSRRSRRPSAGAAKMARPPTTTAMAPADAPTSPSPPVRLASEATPATSSTDAGDDLQRTRGPRRRASGVVAAERPHHGDPDGDRRGRQHDPVARPQADRPADDEHGAGRAADGQLAPPTVGASPGAAAGCRDRCPSRRSAASP